MIDEKKLIQEFENLDGDCNLFRWRDADKIKQGIISLINKQSKIGEWIPVSKKMPENERDVEITYTKKHWKTGEALYSTARAFYTDGIITTKDSDYNWDDYDYKFNWEYSEEKDAYFIPEGWWESVCFGEESSEIADEVIAWRPLSEPYKPNRH